MNNQEATKAKEKELEKLQKQVAEIYLSVSKSYIRMSKVNDKFSYSIIESSIAHQLATALDIRKNVDEVRDELINKWSDRSGQPTNLSQL